MGSAFDTCSTRTVRRPLEVLRRARHGPGRPGLAQVGGGPPGLGSALLVALALAVPAALATACHSPSGVGAPPGSAAPLPASPGAATPGGVVTSPAGGPAVASPAPDPFAQAAALRFATPDALAAALGHAETVIRSGSVAEADLIALAHSEDAAYRQLVDQPEWRAAALAQLPASLRPVAQANVAAGEELKALAHPRDPLPAWRIQAPRPRAELLADYQEAERLTGIPWQYLAAINLVETRMGRVIGLSTAGAVGPMQFIPSTWAIYGRGGDISNPRDSILAAGRLLAAHGGPANMPAALMSYNPSPHYVRAVTAYAQQLQDEPRALAGYYHWQVYFRTATKGEALLSEGWAP